MYSRLRLRPKKKKKKKNQHQTRMQVHLVVLVPVPVEVKVHHQLAIVLPNLHYTNQVHHFHLHTWIPDSSISRHTVQAIHLLLLPVALVLLPLLRLHAHPCLHPHLFNQQKRPPKPKRSQRKVDPSKGHWKNGNMTWSTMPLRTIDHN